MDLAYVLVFLVLSLATLGLIALIERMGETP